MWGLGILKGMVITMRNMLRGSITVQYPDETIELPERARWAVAPKYDEAGAPKCTACTNCVRACPDGILRLDFTTREDKTKHIDDFDYEVGACMFCGLCVEACPFDALEMSDRYELSVTDPEEMTISLLHDVEAASGKRAKVAPKAEPPQEQTPAEDAAGAPEPSDGREGGDADAANVAPEAPGEPRALAADERKEGER